MNKINTTWLKKITYDQEPEFNGNEFRNVLIEK